MPAPTKAGAKAPAPMVVLAISEDYALTLMGLLAVHPDVPAAAAIIAECRSQIDRHRPKEQT